MMNNDEREELAQFRSNSHARSYFALLQFEIVFAARMDQSREASAFNETAAFWPGSRKLQNCHWRLINSFFMFKYLFHFLNQTSKNHN